eukprot:5007992-Prymnesium_polylepis.2
MQLPLTLAIDIASAAAAVAKESESAEVEGQKAHQHPVRTAQSNEHRSPQHKQQDVRARADCTESVLVKLAATRMRGRVQERRPHAVRWFGMRMVCAREDGDVVGDGE